MCQARTGLLHVTRYTAIYEVDVDGGQLVRLGACDASRMDPECAPAYEAEHCVRRKWPREPAGLYVYKLADAPEIVSIAGGELRSVRNNKSRRLSAFTEMLHTRFGFRIVASLDRKRSHHRRFPMQRRAVGNYLGEPRVDE